MEDLKGKDFDIEGKESAKRHWAKVLIKNGILMSWIAFGFSCMITIVSMVKSNCADIKNVDTELIYLNLLTGLGALGFTIAERFNKPIK